MALDGLVRLARAALRGAPRRRVPGMALVVAAGLALRAEQYNHHSNARLDVVEARRTLASHPPPPAECEVFQVAPPFPPGRPDHALQLDAMLLAQRFGIPTVNGYSGQLPRGWPGGPVQAVRASSSGVARRALRAPGKYSSRSSQGTPSVRRILRLVA